MNNCYILHNSNNINNKGRFSLKQKLPAISNEKKAPLSVPIHFKNLDKDCKMPSEFVYVIHPKVVIAKKIWILFKKKKKNQMVYIVIKPMKIVFL